MGSVRRVRPAREWLARSSGPPQASLSTIGPPHKPSGVERMSHTPSSSRATTSGSRAKNGRSRGARWSSGSTAYAATDLAFELVADGSHGIVNHGIGQRLVGRLEAQPVGEAQLVCGEWRALVPIEQGDTGEVRTCGATDRGFDVRRG